MELGTLKNVLVRYILIIRMIGTISANGRATPASKQCNKTIFVVVIFMLFAVSHANLC
jgi:hypothetical protein